MVWVGSGVFIVLAVLREGPSVNIGGWLLSFSLSHIWFKIHFEFPKCIKVI